MSTTLPRPESALQSTPAFDRRVFQQPSVNIHPPMLTPGIAPFLETVDNEIQNTGLQPTALPESMTREDFTRAVAVATVSALRHQEAQGGPGRFRTSGAHEVDDGAAGGQGGHDAPSWSRFVSASVLLGCTALYAIIAGMSDFVPRGAIHGFFCTELLVGVVDVVLEGSGIDEKFLGITLFALVPNTTEFMNAISFALHGNIALRCVGSHAQPFGPLTRVSPVWKSVRRMPCRSVCSRSLLWWLSLPGTLQKRWGPSRRLSGMAYIVLKPQVTFLNV